MTIEEFDKVRFTGGMKIIFREKIYSIMSANFEEKLIAFNIDNDEDLYWIRCENCEII